MLYGLEAFNNRLKLKVNNALQLHGLEVTLSITSVSIKRREYLLLILFSNIDKKFRIDDPLLF